MDAEYGQRLLGAYKHNDQWIRDHSKTFHFATALLPEKERQAIRSLYAFCRVSDDLVDIKGAQLEEIEAWRKQAQLEPEYQQDPVLLAWAHTRQIYKINRRYEDELLDGISMDLRLDRFPDWTSLERYCYLVASTVGLLSTPILGLASGITLEQAEPAAIQLGIALQLTNILRDIGEDAAKGRIYLPLEDLEAFGLGEEDIFAGVEDERFIRLLRFEISRARLIYRKAMRGIKFLSPHSRLAVGTAALLYHAILDEIGAIQYQVYRLRAHTSGYKKLAMLPRIAYTILTL